MSYDFKNYRVLGEVGSGGLGKVYRAIDERTGKIVAIKVLHQKFQNSKRFSGLFHRELMIVSRLKHKHIVSCIDANFSPPNCYIVSEFIDGWSLYAIMKKIGKIPPLVALCIAIEILQGIDYLHLHDMVHSDLSSPNVLIDKIGRVYITDFGLAIQEQIEDYKNYMIGTPGYYSPEHISDSPMMPQSDIYCVGLLIYEMISGDKAVPPDLNRKIIMKNMAKIDYSKITITQSRLRRMICRLLQKALKANVNRRTSSAEAMIFDIYYILKKHHIRYSRYGIHQMLVDSKIAIPPTKGAPQEIYIGYVNS